MFYSSGNVSKLTSEMAAGAAITGIYIAHLDIQRATSLWWQQYMFSIKSSWQTWYVAANFKHFTSSNLMLQISLHKMYYTCQAWSRAFTLKMFCYLNS